KIAPQKIFYFFFEDSCRGRYINLYSIFLRHSISDSIDKDYKSFFYEWGSGCISSWPVLCFTTLELYPSGTRYSCFKNNDLAAHSDWNFFGEFFARARERRSRQDRLPFQILSYQAR